MAAGEDEQHRGRHSAASGVPEQRAIVDPDRARRLRHHPRDGGGKFATNAA